MASRLEALDPARVDEVRIEGEVELHVSSTGPDRVGDELAFDLDRVRNELLERRVARGHARLVRERMAEQRRRGERDLEGVTAGHRAHERGLPGGGRFDDAETFDDLVDAEGYVLSTRVAERHDVVGSEALDRVVERIEEHPPPELAVADHVEPEIDLAPDRNLDRLVLQRT